MSAILFSGSIHQEMRLYVEQSPANHMRLSRQLRLKGAAIKTLRDSLAGGVAFDQIDETIYAILCLAVNQNASLTDRRTPDGSNFDAPFLGVQWLTLYGTMDFDPTHFAAIRALVQRKGGIANLEAYSLGWLIFFAALMGAASRLSPPEFSPVTVHGEPYQYQNPLRLLRVFEMPYHFRLPRGGFHLFERTSIRPDIIQTFLDISEMSQAIQIYLADNRQSRALTDILDSRNDLMYRLLCLPDTLRGPLSLEENPAFAAQNQGMYHMLYLCARLAAQLYSLHVIFPIPTTASIRQTLIPDLLEKVAWFDNLRTVEGSQQLLLWVCVVTAVAVDDDDLDTRGWFVSRCRQLISGLGITTYDDLKDLLHLFGWIDSACDRGGFNIWNMTNIFTH
ncbi:uncharacterized protein A1O5_06500 [Cladophialophora psammophila CBS 110553]|uniref:Transcription factor domain-containing protein n=1 Tax=Cladophialophora psammophila CBS 110553 TaxID=1182543 RepID=W9WQH0_9EURO|nr:uncharacterized protein A1O5_06500 [Cladophialophora psammophila CBS 110553]EXJ70432.1 hypothetical protein A1O5_06500 [Cladophialophora psammophila CBS 110553]